MRSEEELRGMAQDIRLFAGTGEAVVFQDAHVSAGIIDAAADDLGRKLVAQAILRQEIREWVRAAVVVVPKPDQGEGQDWWMGFLPSGNDDDYQHTGKSDKHHGNGLWDQSWHKRHALRCAASMRIELRRRIEQILTDCGVL
jgi:hypothetical protein